MEFAYIDDIFAEPDPQLVQLARQKKMNLFNKVFERVDQSTMMLDKFTLDANVEGFDEITKENLISAIERYPSFVNQITSLTISGLQHKDTERYLGDTYIQFLTLFRVLKLATSLQTLDLCLYNDNKPVGVEKSLCSELACRRGMTSLVIRLVRVAHTTISSLDSLQSLTMHHCRFKLPKTYHPPILPNLTYMGLISSIMDDSRLPSSFTQFPRVFTRLQTLELSNATKGNRVPYEYNPLFIQESVLAGKIKVIGECTYPDPNDLEGGIGSESDDDFDLFF